MQAGKCTHEIKNNVISQKNELSNFRRLCVFATNAYGKLVILSRKRAQRQNRTTTAMTTTTTPTTATSTTVAAVEAPQKYQTISY